MQLTRSISLVASSILAAAIPQFDRPEDIPLCAYSPIQSIINGVGCQVTETSCFCAKPEIVPAFARDVVAACSGTVNSAQVSSFASSFCVFTSSSTTAVTSSSTRKAASITATTSISRSSTSGASLSVLRITGAASTSRFAATTTTNSPLTTAPTSTPASTVMSMDESTGRPSFGMSALALAIAIGGLTWVFAEL